MKRILSAGSLYKNYLMLYDRESENVEIIQVNDKELQWDMYCNSVTFEPVDSHIANVTFKGVTYTFEYQTSTDPMKTLGFGR